MIWGACPNPDGTQEPLPAARLDAIRDQGLASLDLARDRASIQGMKKHHARSGKDRETLAQRLADRLVIMGWFTPGSEGEGLREILGNASDDQVARLIEACDKQIAKPPHCE